MACLLKNSPGNAVDADKSFVAAEMAQNLKAYRTQNMHQPDAGMALAYVVINFIIRAEKPFAFQS